MRLAVALCAGSVLALTTTDHAAARELRPGGKLLLTGGVSSLEGAAGGGLSTWAVIAGNETEDGIGGTTRYTVADTGDYQLRSWGAAVGLFDRVELSFAQQDFDTKDVGTALGLGQGFTFRQDIIGAKVRVLGDAVYDQDTWVPQVAVGLQYKKNNRGAVVSAIGGRSDEGVDVYVAATKVLLNESLVVNGTVRWTKANQTGLLGFGGTDDDYSAQFEGSVGYLVNRRLLVGAEVRTKPDKLAFAKEDAWVDVFAAYAINPNLSITAAYVDLGDIATIKNQRGFYISIQAGF